MRIYADNAATTKMTEAAINAYLTASNELFGNPSSIHSEGLKAADILFEARRNIAKNLSASPESILFTSGGSESNNTAILSAIKTTGKKHIISTSFEHNSVLNLLKYLKNSGYKVSYVSPECDGVINPLKIEELITKDTALVSVMMVNNEIGTIQPIKKISDICKRNNVLLHTDAVQAVGHIPINIDELKVDYLSASSHKFGGPKGCGILYGRCPEFITPLIFGGGQELGLRGGTENIPSIYATSVALDNAVKSLEENGKYVSRLRDILSDGISKISGSYINGNSANKAPGIVNYSFDGVESEPMVLMLDSLGIACSSGSACNSKEITPSHVIMSLFNDEKRAKSSLRFSLSENNSEEEIHYIINSLNKVINQLRTF